MKNHKLKNLVISFLNGGKYKLPAKFVKTINIKSENNSNSSDNINCVIRFFTNNKHKTIEELPIISMKDCTFGTTFKCRPAEDDGLSVNITELYTDNNIGKFLTDKISEIHLNNNEYFIFYPTKTEQRGYLCKINYKTNGGYYFYFDVICCVIDKTNKNNYLTSRLQIGSSYTSLHVYCNPI